MMNNQIADIVLENILTRRSVRNFEPRVLRTEDIEIILRAGDAAPSAGGIKSRKLLPITNQDDLNFIIKYIFSKKVREHRQLFRNVPCIILMCANIFSARKKYRRGRLYSVQDATLAGQNIMLMAHALGIGSCWIGQIRERKLMERFNISAEHKLIGLIALGYCSLQ
ncbi:putative NADH dehydrogenase/NAD(P)H nitroreductase AF_0226 [Gammaproteobacteria bacterium]